MTPELLEQHPDLVPREQMPATAVQQATRGWGRSDRPKPLTVYQADPVSFAVEVLGVPEHTLRWSLNPGYEGHKWDGTPDGLVEMFESVARGENTGVESGTGTGKSFGLAIITLWFLGCWENARVFTYAPTEDQLRLYMWAEINEMWPAFKRRFPTAELNDLRIRMYGSDKWSAHGYAVRIRAGEESATGAQGAHAPHMLLITEETPGIEPSVMKALENTATGAHNVQLSVGNPDHAEDELHRWCRKPHVNHIRLSALDYPNVLAGREIIPGAVTREKVRQRLQEYGATGRLFESRVRGISPSEAADALIRRSWLEAAARSYTDELERFKEIGGKPALGVDVANSEGGDEAAIAEGVGAALLNIDSFPCPDALQLAYQVETRQSALGALDRHVGVDSVGVGSSTMNKGKELGRQWEALNAGSKALRRIDDDVLENDGRLVLDEGEYRNLRAQMWWQTRVDFMRGRVAIPPEAEAPKLWKDLLTPTWTTMNGVIVVEPKEKIVERLGRSPDEGDAFVNWNWVRERFLEKEEEEPPSAWDPEMLQAQIEAERRIRTRPRKPYRSPLDALGV